MVFSRARYEQNASAEGAHTLQLASSLSGEGGRGRQRKQAWAGKKRKKLIRLTDEQNRGVRYEYNCTGSEALQTTNPSAAAACRQGSLFFLKKEFQSKIFLKKARFLPAEIVFFLSCKNTTGFFSESSKSERCGGPNRERAQP